jgi:hypothetical protein
MVTATFAARQGVRLATRAELIQRSTRPPTGQQIIRFA